MPKVSLKINGKDHTLDVPKDMPLLWGVTRQAEYDRYQVWLRNWPMWNLHGPGGW